MADDEFGGGNYGEDKVRILSASSVSKKLTRVRYLISNAKKCDQVAKKAAKALKAPSI